MRCSSFWLKFLSPQGAAHDLLLPWLALTVVQYVVAYCLMLLLLTFRSLGALTLGFAAACGIPTVLVVSALSLTKHNLWSPLGLAVAIVVTGTGFGAAVPVGVPAVVLRRTGLRYQAHLPGDVT